MGRSNQFQIPLALFIALWLPCSARAQSYPERPVTMIVPYAPGSTTDKVARVVADYLAGKLGQTVTVENRSGDAGADCKRSQSSRLNNRDVKDELATLSSEPISLTSKELGRVIKSEESRWGGLSTVVESNPE